MRHLKFLLTCRLFFHRVSGLALAGGLLGLAGAVALLVAVPMLQQQTRDARSRLDDLRVEALRAPSTPALSENDQRLQQFAALLGKPRTGEQHLATVFALARQSGVTLQEGHYPMAHDTHGAFDRYEASFPVKGSYRSIRAFTQRVLRALPFAALEDMQFQRDTVEEGTVQARLRFVLYLRVAGS